jgi:hypothetical protein
MLSTPITDRSHLRTIARSYIRSLTCSNAPPYIAFRTHTIGYKAEYHKTKTPVEYTDYNAKHAISLKWDKLEER